MIHQLRKDLNMSRWEILWGESWINIMMMLADAPHYETKTDSEDADEMTDDDLKKIANQLN